MYKVIHIVPEISDGGGPGGYAFRLMKANKEFPIQGYKIFFGTVNLKKIYIDNWKLSLKDFYKISDFSSLSLWDYGNTLYKISDFPISALLNYDIVVVHNTIIAGQLLNYRSNNIFVIMSHSPTPVYAEIAAGFDPYMCSAEECMKEPIISKMIQNEMQILQSVDFILVPCLLSLEGYRSFLGEKFKEIFSYDRVIECLTGTQVPKITETRERWRNKLKIFKSDLMGLWIGRDHCHRGFDLLVSAFDIIQKRGLNNIKIVCAGINRYINNNLVCLGYVKDIGGLLSAADFFINTDRYSYFNLSCLEAISMGKPLVLTKAGGNKELKKILNSIELVECEPDSIADGILRLISNVSFYEKIRQSHEIYEKIFSPKAFCKQHEKAYNEMFSKLRKYHRSISKIKNRRSNLSILHTVEFYYPHIGGSEIVVQQISERLVKRGHHVEVATTKLPERNFKELNGVKIHEFEIAGNLAYGFTGKDVQRYQDFLINHSADLMMNYAAQQWATDIAFTVMETLKNKKVNIIAPCGYSALQDARTLRWPHFSTYFNQIIPFVIPLYDAAIYHSSMYKDHEFAQLHGFQNSVIIPNGVDEEEFTKKTEIDFRAKYDIKTIYMGICVANFYREKGHDRVIEAVRQMNRKDFTLVFIGKEGDNLEFLKKEASGLNIIFLVNIPREDTVAAFHAADIFLLGSYVEACPLVIIEAKASKTPFVSTDVGNVKEWKGGIVCKPEELAENANRLLDNESLRKQLSEEGYKEWREKLTWDSIVDKYEQLYLKLYKDKENPYLNYRKDARSERKFLFDNLQKNFRDVPSLINLAEIELKNANYKKARNLLIATLALDPENITAKKLLEKLNNG